MPKALDDLRKKIWSGMKGKINPRTKKPYTESDAWAVATSQFKKRTMSYCESEIENEMELMNDAIAELTGGL